MKVIKLSFYCNLRKQVLKCISLMLIHGYHDNIEINLEASIKAINQQHINSLFKTEFAIFICLFFVFLGSKESFSVFLGSKEFFSEFIPILPGNP